MKIIILLLALLILQPVHAFNVKNPFKKKQPEAKAKMVETKQEWEIEATDAPFSERENKGFQYPESDKKYHYPEPHFVFEKYNYPQGTRELNIENIKNKLSTNPFLVADINCRYAAYSIYYYLPEINQISSNFYVEKLDTSKNKTKRMLNFNHNHENRTPVIQAGTKELYPNLFQGLTVIDWSSDSKKVLIKESVGSAFGGIYKTYLYVHYLGNDIQNGYTIKLDNFDETIKNYYWDYESLQLVKYRYILAPLGFSRGNDNIIIILCYALDNDGNKVFLGQWGYNLETGSTMLISKTNTQADVSVNGLILRQVVD